MEQSKSGVYSIEEYKTLRTEILRNIDAGEKNMLACITANAVALAYGANEGNLFVLLFACVVPVYFWVQHIAYRSEIAKLSAYISVFLESCESGLMWETRVQKADLRQNRRINLIYSTRALLMPYPILIIASSFTMLAFIDPADLNALWMLGALIVALLAIVLVPRNMHSFPVLRKEWLALYERMKAEEETLTPGVPPTTTLLSERPTQGLKQTPEGAA